MSNSRVRLGVPRRAWVRVAVASTCAGFSSVGLGLSPLTRSLYGPERPVSKRIPSKSPKRAETTARTGKIPLESLQRGGPGPRYHRVITRQSPAVLKPPLRTGLHHGESLDDRHS
jgi:hypothetical protein